MGVCDIVRGSMNYKVLPRAYMHESSVLKETELIFREISVVILPVLFNEQIKFLFCAECLFYMIGWQCYNFNQFSRYKTVQEKKKKKIKTTPLKWWCFNLHCSLIGRSGLNSNSGTVLHYLAGSLLLLRLLATLKRRAQIKHQLRYLNEPFGGEITWTQSSGYNYKISHMTF